MCSSSDSNLHSTMPLHGDVPSRTKCISLEMTLPLTTVFGTLTIPHIFTLRKNAQVLEITCF